MAKILFVMTGAAYWTLKNGHKHPTGYWSEEFAAPYSIFTGAGHQITVATPGAVIPTLDMMSLRPSMNNGEENALKLENVIREADELRSPISLKDVRLEDYDAVYYPGGHGPMEDLSTDAESGMLLRRALASGKPLAIVCHAPAALLATRDENNETPFANYRLTGFTNDEEAGVGFADEAKWLLEDELRKLPTDYSRGPTWQPYIVVDRNLYTGQNPASSTKLAEEVLKVL
ncbi:MULTISPECIES: type 1 glutamine amidotransferase domain-containing protein [Streptomyces]|uniref:Type 1 glutamine amidotransferase domain-containing protein n=1 Tax=Streptomyces cadmiisoli TaxID=2184053 RepID=A0A2Z4JF65_9ACTN|nr:MULTISPECIES: type 1 glutamine amidotransferase domain-containing protein [Streptomyces]AWW43660.1 type 1 glutamine amidotransferase domain-containing protein [Streptomyces cadmiisoli]KOV49595.1 thiamine biosynthesis protein ThiJ [Streptomyces sp. AS58]